MPTPTAPWRPSGNCGGCTLFGEDFGDHNQAIRIKAYYDEENEAQSELFEQLAQYRRLESQDQSSYQSKLKASWNRLVEARILLKSDIEDRFEISPVLKLIFGTEEAAAVSEEFELMLKRAQQAVPNQGEPHDDDR